MYLKRVEKDSNKTIK